MNKVWIGSGVVFILLVILGMIIHGVLLVPTYSTLPEGMMRPQAEMKMWIIFVVDAVIAYFFTLVFSKGYENKGIAEGVRYGLYIGLMFGISMAYGSYASMPIPYSLALQWFLYNIAMYIICGIALAIVFKPRSAPSA
ncbi:MAG: hypothetical protein HRF44_05125 [Ignavibacterium sp.]|jgi:beta-lactamase regulating signal transducer with metallopeptidase domain